MPRSVPAVRKRLLKLVWERQASAEPALAWSQWRRRQPHRARHGHDRRRGARPPD